MLRLLVALSALLAVALGSAVRLDQAAKDAFVDLQNANRHATGRSMPDLTWDDTLAARAAKHAASCVFAHPQGQKHSLI